MEPKSEDLNLSIYELWWNNATEDMGRMMKTIAIISIVVTELVSHSATFKYIEEVKMQTVS